MSIEIRGLYMYLCIGNFEISLRRRGMGVYKNEQSAHAQNIISWQRRALATKSRIL